MSACREIAVSYSKNFLHHLDNEFNLIILIKIIQVTERIEAHQCHHTHTSISFSQ